MMPAVRSTTLAAVLILMAPLGAQAPAPPQEERPQFRTGVELVQLDVSVLDRDRRPITGLTASDFTLLENGKRRPVRTFTAIQVPARPQSSQSSASAAPVPVPDVSTNRSGGLDGRLVVILMDRSIPTGEPTVTARRIATAAVDALGPNDLAAVVSTSGGVPQNLTADRARLMAAIEQRDWSTGPSKEQDDILASLPLIGRDDPLSDGRCLCGLCVLQTVTRVAAAVQHAPRRHKMLLFIGSSVIVQAAPREEMRLDTGCERPLENARRTMEASLALSHLTVHSIDPSGLASIGPHTRAGTSNKPPGPGRLARVEQMQEETTNLLKAQGSLQYLPELTGGRMVINTNGPEQKVPDIFAESSAYYLLAFESEIPPGSTKASSIEVKVSRPGAYVYAQKKYLAGTDEPAVRPKAATVQPPLMTALRGLFPVATRPLTIAAAAFAGPETRATVVVNVDVGAFGRGPSSLPLDFALSAVDQTGREIGVSTKTMTVSFNAATGDGPAETNVQTTVDLPPGDYEIRMAVGDSAGATVASVFSPLRVPRFADERLSLSDVVVEASGGAPASTTAGQTNLSPTTRRAFDRREQVRARLQISQGTGRTEAIVPASVHTRILDASGRAVRDQQQTLTERDFTNRTAGMAMDMSGLAPGSYVLAIDAAIEGHTASRAVPFTVR